MTSTFRHRCEAFGGLVNSFESLENLFYTRERLVEFVSNKNLFPNQKVVNATPLVDVKW